MAQKLHNMQLSVKPKIAHHAIEICNPLAHHANMHLKQIRKARGLTQGDLADMLGVDTSTIQRAEVMHPSAKLATYINAAQALNVTLPDLFVPYRTDVETAVIEILRRLSAADQARALAMLELAESRPLPASPKTP
jgi:transcriptional regulator with XRE-family HTH domain